MPSLVHYEGVLTIAVDHCQIIESVSHFEWLVVEQDVLELCPILCSVLSKTQYQLH